MSRPPIRLALALTLALFGAAQAKEWHTVTIATEGSYPPYNLHGPDGKLVGYEIDLANDVCKRVNLTCTFVAQDWDGIVPGLQAGKFDAIMSGMSITPKREEVMGFSLPYANSPTTLAVMKGDALENLPGTGVRVSLEDKDATDKAVAAIKGKLKGKVIAVQIATIQADLFNTYFKDAGIDIRTYKTNEQQDLDVHDGRADAELASLSFLRTSTAKGDIVLTGPLFVGGLLGKGSGIAMRKSDTDLKVLFDKGLHEAKADGTMLKLSMQWFGVDVTPAGY